MPFPTMRNEDDGRRFAAYNSDAALSYKTYHIWIRFSNIISPVADCESTTLLIVTYLTIINDDTESQFRLIVRFGR